MFLGLLAGEFAAFAAVGAVGVIFLLGGLQIGFYAADGGGKGGLGEFAFPDGDDGPGEGVETLGVEFVSGDVAGNLLFPEFGVRLWCDVLGTAAVAVPEAAVDEDDGAVLGQHKVGLSWEALVVEPVPVSSAPQLAPDSPFRGGVPGADAGHVVGSLRGSAQLGHGDNASLRRIVFHTPVVIGHCYDFQKIKDAYACFRVDTVKFEQFFL